MGDTVATTSTALALLERNLVEFGEIPLNAAQNFDDETLEAAGRFSVFSEDHAAAIRLAVGASLTARRDGAAQGEWGAWLGDFGAAIGRSIDSLNRWMADAQEHYEIEPPKGARQDRGQHPHGADVGGLGQRPTAKGATGEKLKGAQVVKKAPAAKPASPKKQAAQLSLFEEREGRTLVPERPPSSRAEAGEAKRIGRTYLDWAAQFHPGPSSQSVKVPSTPSEIAAFLKRTGKK